MEQYMRMGTDGVLSDLDVNISSLYLDEDRKFDLFSKVDFSYENAVASAKVGRGVKSEGELIISGTKGYVYVPAPWWKTDYFEIRYEHSEQNKRYFYPLEGECIRYELVAFVKAIAKAAEIIGEQSTKEEKERKWNQLGRSYISKDVSLAIADVISKYYSGQTKQIKQ